MYSFVSIKELWFTYSLMDKNKPWNYNKFPFKTNAHNFSKGTHFHATLRYVYDTGIIFFFTI